MTLVDGTSERPMTRHRHRPNLEVRQGLAEPPNLQVLSAEPRPNQITTLVAFLTYQKMLDQNLEAKNCRFSFCIFLMAT